MNSRCLVSRHPSGPMLLTRDAFVGVDARLLSVSLTPFTVPASNRHLSSLRAFHWYNGWLWRGRRRINQRRASSIEKSFDEISKDVREFYADISRRLNNRRNFADRCYYHRQHHDSRRSGWGNHDYLSESNSRWRRAGRVRNNESQNNKSTKNNEQDEFDELIKKIEADPYAFLFAKSNEYLQLPKSWSFFDLPFFRFGSTNRDAGPKTCDIDERTSFRRDVADQDKHTGTRTSHSDTINYATSAVHDQELQFDPISGRMVPRSESIDTHTTSEPKVIDVPAKAVSISEMKSSENHNDSPDKSVDTTQASSQGPEAGQETRIPEISQFADFGDEDINKLRASDIRASYASHKAEQDSSQESPETISIEQEKENLDKSIQPLHGASTEQVNEAAKDVKGFSGNMQLLNQELIDLCERLESAVVVEPDLYRVLAFDPSTSEVVVAETTSTAHADSKSLSPSEIMPNLNNPARFLPYFAKMKSDGYEIVSGGGNILVFKKTSFGDSSGFNYAQGLPSRISNMQMDSQSAPAAAHTFESIQPIPEAKAAESATSETPSANPTDSSPRIVRRQESIYTGGPPNWSPYPPHQSSYNLEEELASLQREKSDSQKSIPFSVGKTISRVFLTGFSVAGVFYAVGVVCEYFRTGGQDGLGPVGFTEFEAERIRRD